MKARLFVTIACGLALSCASAVAQPGMGGGMPPMGGGMMGGMMMGGMMGGGAVDMRPLAIFQSQELAKELQLTDSQIKKIRKITQKELDRRMNHMLSSGGGFGGFGGGMMGGGMMGGGMMGGPGMGPRMGGGMPGMPGMSEANAEAGSTAEPTPLELAQRAYDRLEQMEETNADIKAQIKIQKKMMKILTEEQYGKWLAIQQRRRPGAVAPAGVDFNLDQFELTDEQKEEFRKRFIEAREKGEVPAPPQGMQFGPGNGFNPDSLTDEQKEEFRKRFEQMSQGGQFPTPPGNVESK